MRRSRAYRWNEDGLAGICDRHQRICFALALWNGRDPILKERLFGLTGDEGNHGEDVKEYYFYLDNTPTHSYMKYLYKYPQAAFPYEQLLAKRTGGARANDPEYELLDTGVFAEDRYFDVFVEYAKAAPEDILIRITAVQSRARSRPRCDVLPTVWFRKRWSWGRAAEQDSRVAARPRATELELDEPYYGKRWLHCGRLARNCCSPKTKPTTGGCWGSANARPYIKDGIGEYVVHGERGRRQSRSARHQGRRPLHVRRWLRANRQSCGCGCPTAPASRRLRPGIRPDLRRPHPRSRRVLRHRHAPPTFRRCARP